MQRETQINIRVSLDEKARLLAGAKKAGMKVSEYIRSQSLEPPEERAKAVVRQAVEQGGPVEVEVKAGTSAPGPYDDPKVQQEVHADFQKLAAREITTLARKRWPHLPLVRAEAKVRAEQ